jgi:endonuclease/exonuclease/phosphatase family metal-dependent hydrolase
LSFSPQLAINEKRILEVDRLIPLIKSRHRYLFGADLNRAADSYTVKLIAEYLKPAGPDYSQPTWPTKPFDYHGQFKETELKWRIDYVFASPDIEIQSSEVVDTAFSDHLPILVKFVFK